MREQEWAPPIPAHYKEKSASLYAWAREGFCAKILVFDDDPTGAQTVHDVPVYTAWDREALLSALQESSETVYIMTNSRALSREMTRKLHEEAAWNLLWAGEKTGRSYLVISRSDSTLRGHYPLETETLRQTLEAGGAPPFDAEILCPYLREGGRVTLGDIHYVRMGGRLVPVGETEFARDGTFPFASSDLKLWIEEKTNGGFPAKNVLSVSLEDLRALRTDAIADQLCSASGFQKVVVNAECDEDLTVFAAAVFTALGRGKRFLFRTAAGFVKALGDLEAKQLPGSVFLSSEASSGGLIVVGSYTEKTTGQLERLLRDHPSLEKICFFVEAVLDTELMRREIERCTAALNDRLSRGEDAVLYTSRRPVRAADNAKESNLSLSRAVSGALSEITARLALRPRFVVAKGGITSSDIAVHALGVRRAWVLGQILPGIPVWMTGPESRYGEMPYVIFPGNIGEEETLSEVYGLFGQDRHEKRMMSGDRA